MRFFSTKPLVVRRSLPEWGEVLLLLVGLVLCLPAWALSEDSHPLRPPDTSSPRDTLTSFLKSGDEFLTEWDSDGVVDAGTFLRWARGCLDLSDVPPRRRWNVESETVLLLREILDRIGTPDLAKVPGDLELATTPLTKWVVPNTEITIERVREGPRKGDFLFNPETIRHAKEFYKRSRHLPYLPGVERDIDLYEVYIFTPGRGLDPAWSEVLPIWAGLPFLDQALWQWVGMVVILIIGSIAIFFGFGWGRRIDKHRSSRVFRIGEIATTCLALGVVLAADLLLDAYINITGAVLRVTQDALILTVYALFGWLTILVVSRIPDAIIASRGFDHARGQFHILRLGFRLLTFIILTVLIIEVAAELGLPAYSVITGIGLGGIAFALAARDTAANLIGSIIIMWDRPFRVGDWVVVGDKEGRVEDIGFRSTRIRTFYNSLLFVPNSDTVNATVDNMDRRSYRRTVAKIPIAYDTPASKIEAFIEGIKKIIRANPVAWQDNFHVVLHEIGEHSLQIMLYFFVRVPDWSSELVERQRVFLEVLRLAEAAEIRLVFPNQTIQVELFQGQQGAEWRRLMSEEGLRTINEGFGSDGDRARPQGSELSVPPDGDKNS
jgi:small-conductance mechanosensitive channel